MPHIFKRGERVTTLARDWDAGHVLVTGEVMSIKDDQLILRADDGLVFPVKASRCKPLKCEAA